MLPLPGRAAQLNLATEQAGQFAADRQPQAGAAVFAAGAGVCLLEGLEDDALLFGRNADPGIGNLEGHDRGAAFEDRMIFAPAARWRPKPTRCTPPCSVNLNALDNRFLSTCCRRFESVTRLRVRCGSDCTSKLSRRFSASCRNGRATMSSRLAKKTSSASTETVPDSIFDRSRMSLIRFSRSVPAP